MSGSSSEASNKRLVVDFIIVIAVQWGLTVLLMYPESFGAAQSLGVIAAIVVYAILLNVFASKGREYGIAKNFEMNAQKKMGISAFAAGLVSAMYFIMPFRELNIIAFFILLDIVVGLLPGGIILHGDKLMQQSKVLYALTVTYTAFLIIVNVFEISLETVLWILSNISGWLFMLFMVVLVIIALLAFFGKKISGGHGGGHSGGGGHAGGGGQAGGHH